MPAQPTLIEGQAQAIQMRALQLGIGIWQAFPSGKSLGKRFKKHLARQI